MLEEIAITYGEQVHRLRRLLLTFLDDLVVATEAQGTTNLQFITVKIYK